MKSIVTGGCGFIGSHIVDRLLAEGQDVVVIDNCSTGRLENLAHHQGNPHLTIVEADICDYEKIAPLFSGVDWVFHMAALADIVPSIQKPGAYFRSNVDGTFSVLQAAKAGGVKRFLYTASSSCYGIPDHFPTDEKAAIRPEYPYALTKRLGEELALHWAKVYHLPVVSLCLFNVYGPRSRTSGTYGAVFGVFLGQKLAGKPYTVVGTGEQTRDFVYVKDVAAANVAALQDDVRPGIYNISTTIETTINALKEILFHLSGIRKDVHYEDERPGDIVRSALDNHKAKELLKWRPKEKIISGLASTYEYFVQEAERE